MALQISPAALRSAARLTSRIGEIGGVAGDNPWKGTYRVVAEGGRLRLIYTDGALTLVWSILVGGSDPDGFDEVIGAAGFDALASRAAEGNAYEIVRSEGLLLTQSGPSASCPQGGTTRLRLPRRSCPALPPRALPAGTDDPGRPTLRWTVPAAPLARALAFVAPFIGTNNPVKSRSVATWTTDGVLIGGSLKKTALVSGLPPSRTPLSFARRAAMMTAAYLERLSGDVEVRVGGAHYSFSSPSAGHVLEVRGEPAPFPAHLLKLDDAPREAYRIDRKTFQSSVAILEVLLPTRNDTLEVRIKGEGENAAIVLSTPGSPATRSTDEFPIIRSTPSSASQTAGSPIAPGVRDSETLFRANGRLLREVLNALGAVTLTCHFDPRNRRIRLEEQLPEGGAARSVLLSVLTPGKDAERDHPSSGPVGVEDAIPNDVAQVAGGRGPA
jgi:hypothetical protein